MRDYAICGLGPWVKCCWREKDIVWHLPFIHSFIQQILKVQFSRHSVRHWNIDINKIDTFAVLIVLHSSGTHDIWEREKNSHTSPGAVERPKDSSRWNKDFDSYTGNSELPNSAFLDAFLWIPSMTGEFLCNRLVYKLHQPKVSNWATRNKTVTPSLTHIDYLLKLHLFQNLSHSFKEGSEIFSHMLANCYSLEHCRASSEVSLKTHEQWEEIIKYIFKINLQTGNRVM